MKLEAALARCAEAGLDCGPVVEREWNVEAEVRSTGASAKVVIWFNAKGELKTSVQGKKNPITELTTLCVHGDEPLTSPFLKDVDQWIGVDESGKGDYFGPLVTAAVLVTPDSRLQLRSTLVRDSKQLTGKAIAVTAAEIRRICAKQFELVVTLPERYNELLASEGFGGNSQRLLGWQHARAIENLLERFPDVRHAVVDQFSADGTFDRALMKRGRAITVVQRTRAEADPAVAAASILARDTFITHMKRLEREAGISLPLGASDESAIGKAAAHIKQVLGPDALRRFVKLHFKTTKKLGLD